MHQQATADLASTKASLAKSEEARVRAEVRCPMAAPWPACFAEGAAMQRASWPARRAALCGGSQNSSPCPARPPLIPTRRAACLRLRCCRAS